ncbi:hypothetical protein J4464_00705 [Candidatus Woesearchaeota archaeon]|nr:hypothetical protein [Candidatus Woesearchaeota archaeon]
MLTKKEIQVLELVKQGLIQEEIAKRLKISQPAVSNFYNNARRKIREAKSVLSIAKEMKLDEE